MTRHIIVKYFFIKSPKADGKDTLIHIFTYQGNGNIFPAMIILGLPVLVR